MSQWITNLLPILVFVVPVAIRGIQVIVEKLQEQAERQRRVEETRRAEREALRTGGATPSHASPRPATSGPSELKKLQAQRRAQIEELRRRRQLAEQEARRRAQVRTPTQPAPSQMPTQRRPAAARPPAPLGRTTPPPPQRPRTTAAQPAGGTVRPVPVQPASRRMPGARPPAAETPPRPDRTGLRSASTPSITASEIGQARQRRIAEAEQAAEIPDADSIGQALRSRKDLRRAIVLKELLGPPVADRDPMAGPGGAG